VSVEATSGEWAAQEALPEHGRNPYADRAADEEAVQDFDGITAMDAPQLVVVSDASNAGLHGNPHDNAIVVAPTSLGELTEDEYAVKVVHAALHVVPVAATAPMTTKLELGDEVASAVSVAVAYFEDTLAVAPETILSAGPMGAVELNRVLRVHRVAEVDGVEARELVPADAVSASATDVPRGWLTGVMGALRG
jgi:hypothetical protein